MFSVSLLMPTYDFEIVRMTTVPGISLVMAQNEDAFSYITDELELSCFQDGSVPIHTNQLPEFAEKAERAHMACALV